MISTRVVKLANVYTDDANVAALVNGVAGFKVTDNPNIADQFICSSEPTFDLTASGIDSFYKPSVNLASNHAHFGFADQQSRLKVAQYTTVPVSDLVAVVPFHQFIDSSSFHRFKNIYPDAYFDLIETNGNDDKVIDTNTIGTLINDYPALLAHSELPNVFFSREKKYIVKLSRDDVKTVYGVYGTQPTETISDIVFTTPVDKETSRSIASALRWILAGQTTFFTFKYYYDVKKVYIYDFNVCIPPEAVDETFISIPEVQKLMENMSTKIEML